MIAPVITLFINPAQGICGKKKKSSGCRSLYSEHAGCDKGTSQWLRLFCPGGVTVHLWLFPYTHTCTWLLRLDVNTFYMSSKLSLPLLSSCPPWRHRDSEVRSVEGGLLPSLAHSPSCLHFGMFPKQPLGLGSLHTVKNTPLIPAEEEEAGGSL